MVQTRQMYTNMIIVETELRHTLTQMGHIHIEKPRRFYRLRVC